MKTKVGTIREWVFGVVVGVAVGVPMLVVMAAPLAKLLIVVAVSPH